MVKSIIVEGADQQGKSTLCKYLSEHLGWPIVHFGPPPPGFDFHQDYVLPDNTISDRNFVSELVYSAFRQGGSRVKDVNALMGLMKNTLLIIVDRGDAFVFEDRQEKFTREQIETARNIYRAITPSIAMQKITLDNPCEDTYKRLLFNIKIILTAQSAINS